MTTIINLFGGPSVGKTIYASGLFSMMRLQGYNCELIVEYAKDLAYEKRIGTAKNQIYVFGKQYKRMQSVIDNDVNYLVTDSPLLLSLVYEPENYFSSFKSLVREVFSGMNNVNFYLTRGLPYSTVGRFQTEEEAKQIDNTVLNVLHENGVEYKLLDVSSNEPKILLEEMISYIEDKKLHVC